MENKESIHELLRRFERDAFEAKISNNHCLESTRVSLQLHFISYCLEKHGGGAFAPQTRDLILKAYNQQSLNEKIFILEDVLFRLGFAIAFKGKEAASDWASLRCGGGL